MNQIAFFTLEPPRSSFQYLNNSIISTSYQRILLTSFASLILTCCIRLDGRKRLRLLKQLTGPAYSISERYWPISASAYLTCLAQIKFCGLKVPPRSDVFLCYLRTSNRYLPQFPSRL